MKRFVFSFLILLFTFPTFAQTTKDSITICNVSFKLPDSLTSKNEFEIRGENFTLNWSYMEKSLIDTVPQLFVNQMEKNLENLKKSPIKLYILDEPANGYRLSYNQGNNKSYQLIAYGTANNQPVFIQLLMQKEPAKDKDLPAFVREIIRLKK